MWANTVAVYNGLADSSCEANSAGALSGLFSKALGYVQDI